MSNSVQPHRWQPIRLPHYWDSPGKNTGVGCHFLLQFMKVKSEKWKWSRSVMSNPQRPHVLQPTRLLCPWDFLGKNTGVGCHCLLQHPYMATGKIIALTRRTIVGKVMSLLFNMVPRLVIDFFSNEQASLNFMAAVTICCDFGAPKNKVSHCSYQYLPISIF